MLSSETTVATVHLDQEECLDKIINAEYTSAEPMEIVDKIEPHIPENICQDLRKTLEENKEILSGLLGMFRGQSVTLNLKDNVNIIPYHVIAYKIPVSQKPIIRKKLERLEDLDVIEKVDKSEWAAPVFAISKKNWQI